MTDTPVIPTPLNVNVTPEPESIAAPMRATPGGGQGVDRGGVARAIPGGGSSDLGSGARQQVTPSGAAPAEATEEDTPAEGAPVQNTEAADPKTAAPTPEETHEATQPDIPPELQAKMEPFSKEVSETGTLSDASVAKAAAEFGVTEDMVRQYIANGQAQGATPQGLSPEGQAVVDSAYEMTGGQEHYDGFVAWLNENAKDSLGDLAFAADSGKPSVLKAIMAPLVAQWKESGGGPAPRTARHEAASADAPAQGGVEGFTSRDEQLAAMRDKRYGKDPAYTAQTDQRIVRSTWASAR